MFVALELISVWLYMYRSVPLAGPINIQSKYPSIHVVNSRAFGPRLLCVVYFVRFVHMRQNRC